MNKENTKQNLEKVIQRFNRWKAEGRLDNEDDIKDLIKELFEDVLGWDKDDIYRERHPGPTAKRADFQFRINNAVKLILETKALNVSWDQNTFKQAIGYGWGSNKEYVVLTNFKKFILFNAKWQDKDKRIFEIENIEDCLKSEQMLDFLLYLSKESFNTGKIDEFSEAIGKKNKKASITTIDKQLLKDLKKWREILYNNIKKLNTDVKEDELDDIVQKIIMFGSRSRYLIESANQIYNLNNIKPRTYYDIKRSRWQIALRKDQSKRALYCFEPNTEKYQRLCDKHGL